MLKQQAWLKLKKIALQTATQPTWLQPTSQSFKYLFNTRNFKQTIMKKIILAAAIVLTTGALTLINKENNTKKAITAKSVILIENSFLATAD
jgi:hypothetical protein